MNLAGLWQDFVRRFSLMVIRPNKPDECDRRNGTARHLDEWRSDIMRGRTDITITTGMYLDRSPTGSGKTTADIASV